MFAQLCLLCFYLSYCDFHDKQAPIMLYPIPCVLRKKIVVVYQVYILSCSLPVPRMKRSASDVAFALTYSPIRRLSMNQKSRHSWPSERPLSRCKQQQRCLFAHSTSLATPFRAVSTRYSHKRDQPNSVAAVKVCY